MRSSCRTTNRCWEGWQSGQSRPGVTRVLSIMRGGKGEFHMRRLYVDQSPRCFRHPSFLYLTGCCAPGLEPRYVFGPLCQRIVSAGNGIRRLVGSQKAEAFHKLERVWFTQIHRAFTISPPRGATTVRKVANPATVENCLRRWVDQLYRMR